MEHDRCILVLNGGSSSLKFALCGDAYNGTWKLRGQFERLSTSTPCFVVREGDQESRRETGALDQAAATRFLLDWLEERLGLASIAAVGYRVVHGEESFR